MREYRIKRNFAKAGNMGPYPIRNVVEAAALSLIWIILIWKVPAELSIRLMLLVLTIVPTLAITLLGIQGNSLMEIAFRYIRFHLFTRRVYFETSPKEYGEREKKILRIKKKQLDNSRSVIKEEFLDEADKGSRKG